MWDFLNYPIFSLIGCHICIQYAAHDSVGYAFRCIDFYQAVCGYNVICNSPPIITKLTFCCNKKEYRMANLVKAKSREVPRDIQGKSREKTRQVRENWSQQFEHMWVSNGREQGVRKGEHALPAYHTRCKCSMETTRNLMNVKLGYQLMKSLIGMEVVVPGRGSECHLTYARGRLHIAD